MRRRCACNRAWRRVGRAPRWAAHGLRAARQEQHRTEHHAAHCPTRAALCCTGLHSALRRGGAVAGARHAVASDTQGLLPLRLRNSGSGSGNLSMTRNVTCGKRESANYFLHPSPGCSGDQATLFKNLHRPARTDLHSRSAADFEQYHRVVQGGACAAIAQQVCAAATVATMSVATARSGARSCRSTLSSRGSAPLTCTAGTRSGSGR